MSSSQETALRYLAIYKCLASNPSRKWAVSTLQEKLAQEGFDVSERTLQRDLKNKLSLVFPIICDDREKPYRWSLAKGAIADLKIPDIPTALSLNLAQKHLKTLLPQTILQQLKNRFDSAEKYLKEQPNNRIVSNWQRRVYAIPNGKALIPAELSEQTWSNISDALLNKSQLQISYEKPDNQGQLSQWRIHPQGLVSRHNTSYLIATINDYKDLKILALHRIKDSQVLNRPCTQCSVKTLEAYIKSGELGWGTGEGEVELIADVSPYTAAVLSETPLSHDQTIEPIANSDWHRLTASVPKNQETLWWIHSLNHNIRVHQPTQWVEAIKNNLSKLQTMYETED